MRADQEWEGPAGELAPLRERAAELATRDPVAVECVESGHRWHTRARPGTVLRCPECRHPRRVPRPVEPARRSTPVPRPPAPRPIVPPPAVERSAPVPRPPAPRPVERPARTVPVRPRPAPRPVEPTPTPPARRSTDLPAWAVPATGLLGTFFTAGLSGALSGIEPPARPGPRWVPPATRSARPTDPDRIVAVLRRIGIALIEPTEWADGNCWVAKFPGNCPELATHTVTARRDVWAQCCESHAERIAEWAARSNEPLKIDRI